MAESAWLTRSSIDVRFCAGGSVGRVRMSQRRMAIAVGFGVISSLVTACGSAESASEGTMPELSESERAAMNAEVGTLQQKLGEQTCATTPRDALIDVLAGGIPGVGSSDALYD